MKNVVIKLLFFSTILLLSSTKNALAANAVCNPPCSGSDICTPILVGDPPGGPGRCTRPAPPTVQPGQGVSIGTYYNSNFRIPSTSIGFFISIILPTVYTLALLTVLGYLIWGSLRYILAGGDPKAIAAAKAHLTWAVLGMVIIFLSYGVFQLVNSLLGNAFS